MSVFLRIDGPKSLSIPVACLGGSGGILGIERHAHYLPQTHGLSLEWFLPKGQDAHVEQRAN